MLANRLALLVRQPAAVDLNPVVGVEFEADTGRREGREEASSVRSMTSGRSLRRGIVAVVTREHIEKAHEQARRIEKRVWEAVDQDAPASVANARAALKDELLGRSKFDDPEDVPKWVKQAVLGDEADLPDWAEHIVLTGRGHVSAPSRVAGVSMGSSEPSTLGDLQALRSRIGREIREERAATAPNRNKIRILEGLREALLRDMEDTGADGIDGARAFSRELNRLFTSGRIGKLRGFERPGEPSVDPRDTLSFMLSGSTPARSIRQMIEGSPDTAAELERYLKAAFLSQAVDGNGVNTAAANRFLTRWESKGIFELFPKLRAEFEGVRNLQQGARRLRVRAENVERFAHHAGKSRAALYLNAPVGEEMQAVLRARNPAAVARALVRRVEGDRSAVQGLKTSFVEELMQQATSGFDDAGEAIVSGAHFGRLLREYGKTARALDMTDAELDRLDNIVKRLTLAEQKAGRLDKIVEDTPSMVLDLVARWLGAQSGQRLGSGMGSSLVLAQWGSTRFRRLLEGLTRDRAREILIAAHQDPELYRALLTRPTDGAKRKAEAARKLEAWMAGVALPGEGQTGERQADQDRPGGPQPQAATELPSPTGRPAWASGEPLPAEWFEGAELEQGYEYDVEMEDGRPATIRLGPDGRVYEVGGASPQASTGRQPRSSLADARRPVAKESRADLKATERAGAALDRGREPRARDIARVDALGDDRLAQLGISPDRVAELRLASTVRRSLADARRSYEFVY